MVNLKEYEILKLVSTQKATVYLLNGDIVKMVPFENAEVDVKDLEEIQRIKFDMVGNRKYAVLFVTPLMGIMTKEARAFASGELVNKNAVGKAVIIKNMGMRMLASFFIKFNKPVVEHRIFESEEIALEWLQAKMDS